MNQFRAVVFMHRQVVPIAALQGFAKPLQVPKRLTSASKRFVVAIAQANLDQEIESVRAAIRRTLKYDRKSLKVFGADGTDTASIGTKDFEYFVQIDQLEEDPSKAVLTRELSEVRDQGILDDPKFQTVFDEMFDTVRMTFAKPLDVALVIDKIEERDGDEMEVEYPADLSSCVITLHHCADFIRIKDGGFELTFASKRPLSTLLNAFAQTIQAMSLIGIAPPVVPPNAIERKKNKKARR